MTVDEETCIINLLDTSTYVEESAAALEKVTGAFYAIFQ